jgi:hypothetical protein
VSSPRRPASPNQDASEGIPDSEDLTQEQAATGQDEGESLDGRLAREEPTDTIHPDESGRSAEESAMHLEPGL